MKRLVCLVIMVMLVFCSCSGVAESASVDDLLLKMMNDWVNVVYQYERLYTQQNAALNAMIQFSESGEWDDLVRARTSSLYTVQMLEHYCTLELEQSMTYDDYRALADQGIELSNILDEINGFRDECMNLIPNDVELWREHIVWYLIEDVCFQSTVNDLSALAKILLSENTVYMKHYCLVSKYIMLLLPEEQAEKLAGYLQVYAPNIWAMDNTLYETEDDVFDSMNRNFDTLEALKFDYEKQLAQSEAFLENPDYLERTHIANSPAVLPFPEFWHTEEANITYYWLDDNQNMIYPSGVNDDMKDRIPDRMVAVFPFADQEDCDSYVELLESMGIVPASSNETETMYILEDGVTMMLRYTDKGVSLGVMNGQLFFVPQWIISDN